MRILMMGTGGFAVPTFRALLASEHEVLGLVTRPPQPFHGRRKVKVAPNPMRDVAEEAGLSIMMPDSINTPESIEEVKEQHADLHVVCDYGQILSREALTTAPLGGINLHASLLPRYRGAAPINWVIYEGDETTGVTVIHMTAKLDAGPNLVQVETPIAPTEDAVDLESRLADTGTDAVLQAIDMLSAWDRESPIGTLQDGQEVSKAPRLKKSDGRVEWSRTATEIFDQVRAFKPWPGSYTEWQYGRKPMRLALQKVEIAEAPADCPPGTIAKTDRDETLVACGQGAIRLIEVQPAGKKAMAMADFLRGHPLSVGDSLSST